MSANPVIITEKSQEVFMLASAGLGDLLRDELTYIAANLAAASDLIMRELATRELQREVQQ